MKFKISHLLILFSFQLAFSQYPSIKEKGFRNYEYSFQTQKQSGLPDFAIDSTNTWKVKKLEFDKFLKDKIYSNVTSSVIVSKTSTEFKTDSTAITPSFNWDPEKEKLYRLIKNEVQIAIDGEHVVIGSTNFENMELDEFLNENLIVGELPAVKENLFIFSNKIKQLDREINEKETAVVALENSNRNFEAQRLKAYVASLKKDRDELEGKFTEAKEDNYNEFFIGLNDEPISRWMQRIYSKENERIYLANEATLQFNNEGSIVDTELATAFMGPLKLNFGTVISNQNESNAETQDTTMDLKANQESIQRLITGGGNTYLSAELPIGYFSTNRFTFYTYLGLRGSLEISEFSDDVDTTSGMYSGTGNVFASLTSDNKEFNFYIHIRYGLYGGSNEFRTNLAVDEDYFDFGTISSGVTISNSIRIAFTFKPFSSQDSLSDGKTLIGIQFLPNFLKI
ncbi:hypothetical protein [Nonlabens xiamenensis]|uniref:hypothetical protein n=1 Tax=Nonlabens xiamenensis TaxID=2341043 RepID=UPI000F6068A4|nr:hypothetical protein [Nonlabens xiamenensis]